MEYYILRCYQEAKNKSPEVEQGLNRFEPKIKKVVIACFSVLLGAYAESVLTMLFLPKQFWSFIGMGLMLVSMGVLIWVDEKDKKKHMDKYVNSNSKKIELLEDVLKDSKFNINNRKKIEELISIYQEYIEKEIGREKKRYRMIVALFSTLAGILTISFENMGVVGIDFSSWLYFATLLLIVVSGTAAYIYLNNFFNPLKRKYELMIKDLKDLLLIKY